LAKLPNTYDRRPTPSYGRTRQLAPVVPVDEGKGFIALGAGIADFAGSMKKLEDDADRSDAVNAINKFKAWALKDKYERWGNTLGENITKDFMPKNKELVGAENDRLKATLSEGGKKYFKPQADILKNQITLVVIVFRDSTNFSVKPSR